MTKFEVINNNLIIVTFIAFCSLWGLKAGDYFDFDIRLLIILPLSFVIIIIQFNLNAKYN